MNIVKKLSVFILAFILLGGSAMAATVDLEPTTVPIGAYVNGSDGDQHFVQSLVFTWAVTDAWGDGDDIIITLPTSMTVADVDEDGSYADEISMSWLNGAGGSPAFTVAATSTAITVTATTGANVDATDELTIFFPVETDENVADGTTETYTFAATAAAGVNEAAFTATTVTYTEDVLTYVTFAPDYAGSDESTELGDVYPAAAQAVTAALPNIIVDQADAAAEGADDWANFDFDQDDAHATGVASTTAEVLYYLWAAQDSSLLRIDEEAGGHIPIAADQSTDLFSDITRGNDEPNTPTFEGGTWPATQLNGTLLTEGVWFFYVTSSVTADWVLGRSDSVDIRHWPVFDAGVAGLEAIADFDGDGLFENNVAVGGDGPGVVGGDDVTEMYLESGGGVDVDGDWDGTYNADNVSFHWNVTDVDDNANVKIYRSTTDGITDKATLLADANTVQISPDTLYEEGTTSVFWNYDIYTDATTYEPAGDYYIYFLADDGKNSNVFQMVDAADADFQLLVKHYPNLVFQDVSYLHDENTGDVDIDFSTETQQYITFNWGETIDGDKDADGNVQIDLYISDFANAASGYSANVSTVDATLLPADAIADPTHTVHVATIIDSLDGRNDNRYVYDLRNSGLAAGTYYMYAIISEKGDEQVVQMYNTVVDDRPVTLTHGTYYLDVTPPKGEEGEYVNLKKSDRYTFKWDGFDKDATSTDLRVGIIMVPQGTATLASATFDTDGLATAGYYYLVSDDNGENIAANANAPIMSAGEYVVDFSDITTDAAGNATDPSGDYDVYYVYTDDGDFTDAGDDVCIQAAGPIHIESFDDPVTSFELSPNRFVATKGDTIDLEIYATDGGIETAMILSVFMDVPTEKFDIVDQDATADGIQAWSDEVANFNGTEFLDTVTVNGGFYEIDYVEYAGVLGDALATSLHVGTIQLVANANYTGFALEKHEITFSTTGDRKTGIVGVNSNQLATTVPPVAATVEFATPGTIKGHVEIEARPDAEGETVEFLVVETGSVEMISDADFLSANGLSSATDTLTVTLGPGGSYEILRVPTGTYDIVVHKDGWLDERIERQSVQSLSYTYADFEGDDKMLVGDCSGYTDADGNIIPDNQISADDHNALNSAFNATPTDPNWNALCDFDGDDFIFTEDLRWATLNGYTSGEGLLYKEASYNGSNEGAKFELAQTENNMFVVRASELAHISAYAVEVSFNDNEWELKASGDGLEQYRSTYDFRMNSDNSVLFVSAIYGKGGITSSELDLVTMQLNPKVDNPSMPELINVSVVDANFNETQGFIKASSLVNLPTEFKLEKNYPNPFNPVTNIRFAIPEQGNVKLVVYDLLGNRINTLVSNNMKAGHYSAVWNARNDAGLRVSSGVYFYRLMIGNKVVDTKKMVLMK